jgi:hypothetical protein
MDPNRPHEPPYRTLENGKRRSLLDRRSGEDRRKAYSLDYFLNGGVERRKGLERRRAPERRKDWRRVGKWYSVYCGDD